MTNSPRQFEHMHEVIIGVRFRVPNKLIAFNLMNNLIGRFVVCFGDTGNVKKLATAIQIEADGECYDGGILQGVC